MSSIVIGIVWIIAGLISIGFGIATELSKKIENKTEYQLAVVEIKGMSDKYGNPARVVAAFKPNEIKELEKE